MKERKEELLKKKAAQGRIRTHDPPVFRLPGWHPTVNAVLPRCVGFYPDNTA